MTTTANPPDIRSHAEPLWLWAIVALVLTPFIALGLLAAGIGSYFRLSSDASALRNGVIESSGVDWQKLVAVNVGGFTFGTVRAGLSFARLPEEARMALAAVRGVEVGVYRLPTGAKSPDCAAMMVAAERAMVARGWERVVRVMDGGELVAVYVPRSAGSDEALKCCVLVFDGDKMVIASAKAELGPLIQRGLEKLPGALALNNHH